MTKMKVLISGASVAGPALACLLYRDGFDVTVVERAAAHRMSGYAVDFRDEALDVLEDLGILAEVREHDTKMRGTTLIDERGAETGRLPAEAFAGELEVPKRELTRILYRITSGRVNYVFGDSISAMSQHESGVTVWFDHSAPRDFDLVFGADGLYSRVRRLTFGSDPGALRHLGLSGVGFSTGNYLGLDHVGLLRQFGGTAVYLFSAGEPDRLTASLSFATASSGLDRRGRDEQEEAVRTAFVGHGWEVPRLLAAMSQAGDFYFSSASQVRLDRWSRGRVALVGDAGYCAAPTSGMGTSQALIGARTLARSLALARGDHRAAFGAYETELRPYVARNQAEGRRAAATFGAAEPSIQRSPNISCT